jgi:phenylpropionate dioxygenase-like ring-hydroxylating dioxygenase large terminal subunit
MLGRRLVGFRTAGGRLAVLDAVCSHLGADLGNGSVVGEAVRCPFHHWEYGPDGACTRVPARAEVPPFARQRAYPVAERHGSVFVFNGPKPLFPLPFFPDCRPEDLAPGRLLHFTGECSWQMFASNNCDVQHWNTVHDRRLLAPPAFDLPHPLARRVTFEAQVVGTSVFDRCLRAFAGDRVAVSIVNWGGVFFVVSGLFRRVHSRMLVAVRPLDGNRQIEVEVTVFVRRGRFRPAAAPAEALALWVRRLFTWGFLREEFQRLAGIRYSPHTLIECDRDLVEFFRWAADLPGDEGGSAAEASRADRA